MNPIKTLLASILGLISTVALVQADIVVTRLGTKTGEVVRVYADGAIDFRTAEAAEFKFAKAEITRVDVPKPPAYDAAVAALKAGKYREAIDGLTPLVNRYAGLEVPWVQNAMFDLGDAHLGNKATTLATSVLDRFKTLYPNSPLTEGLDVKTARLLSARGNCAEAIKKLNGVLQTMYKKDFLTDVQEGIVAEALLLQGDCNMTEGKTDDALDCYLKVITLFDLNADRTSEARYKAGLAFEKLGNWKRAKGTFEELLKNDSKSEFVADAKKHLEAINKDHPE
jgi:TolA-binding protein